MLAERWERWAATAGIVFFPLVVVSIALSAMEIFGTLIAAFLGSALVAGDVERRTVYPIVAKPVSRAQYVAGRYLGLVATTTLNLAVMALVFVAVLAVHLKGLGFVGSTPLFATLGATAVQFAMIAAVAVFFSSFTTATLASIFTLSFVVAGHLASDLIRYWSTQGVAAGRIGKAIYLLVPNLEALNLKEAMVYKDAVAAGPLAASMAYGILYSAGIVALAAAVFTRRDLR